MHPKTHDLGQKKKKLTFFIIIYATSNVLVP